MNYDGWAIKRPEWNNYIDPQSFRRTRSQCINDFVQYSHWNWRQLRQRGWQCVKVKLVEVTNG